MTLRFVTSNPNKVAEIARAIPAIEQLDIDLPEIQDLDPHAIVRAKLTAARERSDDDLIVEDTSLTFACLGALPGPFVKYFVGELGARGLWELVSKYDDHRAIARTIIGYGDEDGMRFFEGLVEGRIVAPRGEGFGWDPIFEPDGHEKTYAEMTRAEKGTMSHRARAVEQLIAYLQANGS